MAASNLLPDIRRHHNVTTDVTSVPPHHDVIVLDAYAVANVSNISYTPIARDEELAKIEIGVQAFIFCLALVGNTCVLMALRYRKKKTSRMHLFIMHLSIADLLVAFCNVLPQLAWDVTYQFKGPDVLCRVVKYLQVMVIYLSTYVLVMTAVDRYRAICHPLSNYSWSTRRANLMIGVAWVISLILSLPQLVIFRMKATPSGVVDCWAEFGDERIMKAYVTCFMVSVYILPFFILTVLYGRITYELWWNLRRRKFIDGNVNGKIVYKFNGTGTISIISPNDTDTQEWSCLSGGPGLCPLVKEADGGEWDVGVKKASSSSSCSCDCHRSCSKTSSSHQAMLRATRGLSRSKMKTIKLTFVVILAYMFCWSPFFITQMWWAFDETAPANNHTFVICLLLASLNSCCNPWIYMAFSTNFIQTVLPCFRYRPRKPNYNYHQRVCSFDAGAQKPSVNSQYEQGTSVNENAAVRKLLEQNGRRTRAKSEAPGREPPGSRCVKCAAGSTDLWQWRCNLFPSAYRGRFSGYPYNRSQPVGTCHNQSQVSSCQCGHCVPLHDIKEERVSDEGWSFFRHKPSLERYLHNKKSRKSLSQPSLMASRHSSDVKLEARCTSV